MAPRYRVTLTQGERQELEQISTKGQRAARTILYSRALLLLDASEDGPRWQISKVAEALGASERSLTSLKKRFVEEGLSSAIGRKKRVTPPKEKQFDGKFEAQLIALACSEPPEGRKRWSMRLLADQMVELRIVESVSAMTVCTILKKMNLSLT